MINLRQAVVVLSGGLDSSVNLMLAKEECTVVKAITFNYGQRAFIKERQAASQIAEAFKVSHQVYDLTWIKDLGQSALTSHLAEVPTSDVKIDDHSQSLKTAHKVWVPNRNGVFLNVAAAIAESLSADYVVPGFNKEEAATFPDNSEGFMKALDQSFHFSTSNQVKVKCYTSTMDKTEIVKTAINKNFPLELIWPCYFSGESWCGRCESCQRSKRAFEANGIGFVN